MATREEEPLKKQQEYERERTVKDKLTYLKDNITIEPLLIMYVMAGVLMKLATQNLNLDKACRVNLKYGDKVCDALIAKEGALYQQEELAMQELVASIEAWKNFILTSIPSLLILFVGAWSDKTGKRKICILLPIFGELLTCLNNLLNVYYFYELPVEVAMFFDGLLPAVTGGWITIFMGVFSYISEISSEETRTFRVGIANFCLTAGGPIGTAISGILLKHTGYYGVFTICTLMFSCSIGLGLLFIKHPERPMTAKKTVGEGTIRYLFTRYRFNWDAVKFSFYNTFYIGVHTFGSLIAISLFSRRWQWGDPVLGMISSVSKIMGAILTGLSRNSLDMYIAVVLETFNGISFTSLRSMSSKLVSSDELGKMISVFNLTEVLTAMVFGPLYSWIYMVSLKIDSGIIYLFSTLLTVPSIIFYIYRGTYDGIPEKSRELLKYYAILNWFYIQDKKDAIKNKNEIMNNKERVTDQEFKPHDKMCIDE